MNAERWTTANRSKSSKTQLPKPFDKKQTKTTTLYNVYSYNPDLISAWSELFKNGKIHQNKEENGNSRAYSSDTEYEHVKQILMDVGY